MAFHSGLITATLIGALWPAPGQAANKMEPIKVSQIAVVLIFFIQGLKLKTEDTVRHRVDSCSLYATLGLTAAAGDVLTLLPTGPCTGTYHDRGVTL